MKLSSLKENMTFEQRKKLGDKPTYHSNMIEIFGVGRLGKTKRDRQNNGLRA